MAQTILAALPQQRPSQAVPLAGMLLSPGASCGFIAPCTRIGEIGLHIAALSSLRTDKDRSFADVQGQARLGITFLDLAEVGTVFAGHIGRAQTGTFSAISSPATAYARLRLLPLPFLRPLTTSFLRLALHAQHDFVDANFGALESPGIARTTLHVVGGKSYGPIDLDGSVGFVLTTHTDRPPQQAAFQLGLAASYWFRRAEKDRPTDQLRLQLEALYQFAQDRRFSTQGTLLAGLLGMSRSGFGGSFAVGPEFLSTMGRLAPRGGEPHSALPNEGDLEGSPLNDQYAGVRVMGGVQFSWGPHVRNPWAERKAAQPKETPAWIWTLLGAIDPILREDGCVWTDPTPRQASYKWFCIGKPDPQNPGMILLDNGMRLPVGTHLLEHGTALRMNDGTKVAQIPLTARLRRSVLDYVDGLMRHDPDPKLCEGKIDPIPQGIDAGWASVVAHDDFGGGAAVLGMQIYRQITCDPEAQSSIEMLSLLGKVGGRGPLRAKPNLNEDRFAQPGKPRTGSGGGDIAEHKQPVSVQRGRLEVIAGSTYSPSEQRAAQHMANTGHHVVLRPPQGTRASGMTSDLLVDGRPFDVYTPRTHNPDRIVSAIAKKNSQARGIVLDLSETKVSREQLGDLLARIRGAGATSIDEIIIIGD